MTYKEFKALSEAGQTEKIEEIAVQLDEADADEYLSIIAGSLFAVEVLQAIVKEQENRIQALEKAVKRLPGGKEDLSQHDSPAHRFGAGLKNLFRS